MALNMITAPESTSEINVAAPGGQGARALAALLADVGQMHGMPAVSRRSGTERLNVRGVAETETATVQFANCVGRPFKVAAVLQPELMATDCEGLMLVNYSEPIRTETVRSVDADGIAHSLGVPAYLPMVGAVAKAAGWMDLGRVKAAVKIALQDTAPYWVGPGLAAVEAGYQSLA